MRKTKFALVKKIQCLVVGTERFCSRKNQCFWALALTEFCEKRKQFCSMQNSVSGLSLNCVCSKRKFGC